MNKIILANGVEIPAIGLGTYPLNGNLLTQTVNHACNIGYRLIDTADNYYNEADLGASLEFIYNKKTVRRDDLFLVSKISDELYKPSTIGGGSNKGLYFWKNSPTMHEERAVRKIIKQKIDYTLTSLKTDYLDLLLMHWPYPDFFEEIWFEMEKLYKNGKIRSLGVCNCRERHFEKLRKNCTIFPMVNQFESSPINTKESLINYCHDNNVHIMIYSPLMNLRLHSKSRYKEYLKELSNKYNKTVAQIVLRFDVQRGLIPIPKSTHEERLNSNFNIFNFKLEKEEMQQLLMMNENAQTLPESRSCPGL